MSFFRQITISNKLDFFHFRLRTKRKRRRMRETKTDFKYSLRFDVYFELFDSIKRLISINIIVIVICQAINNTIVLTNSRRPTKTETDKTTKKIKTK